MTPSKFLLFVLLILVLGTAFDILFKLYKAKKAEERRRRKQQQVKKNQQTALSEEEIIFNKKFQMSTKALDMAKQMMVNAATDNMQNSVHKNRDADLRPKAGKFGSDSDNIEDAEYYQI